MNYEEALKLAQKLYGENVCLSREFAKVPSYLGQIAGIGGYWWVYRVNRIKSVAFSVEFVD